MACTFLGDPFRIYDEVTQRIEEGLEEILAAHEEVELGNSGISLERFVQLCQLLNVNAHTILFGDVEEEPLLFNLGTMLANRDAEDVRRVVSILEAVTEAYFRK